MSGISNKGKGVREKGEERQEVAEVVWGETKPTYQQLEVENARLREWFNRWCLPDDETIESYFAGKLINSKELIEKGKDYRIIPTYQELEAENARLRDWFDTRRQPDYETLKKALEIAIDELNHRRKIVNRNLGFPAVRMLTIDSWIELCKSKEVRNDG